MLPVIDVRVSVTFHLMCVSSVWVVEWPHLGNSSLCILTICNFSYFRFGFKGWIWVLIASVPGFCIHFTFINTFMNDFAKNGQ